MSFKTASILAALTAALGLAGCGPTATGIKAREDAHARIDLFNAQLAFDQAKQFYEVGRFEQAMRQIDSAIATWDSEPTYYLLQGRIYLETHHLQDALQSFQTALEHDEENAQAHYFQGIVFQRWSDNDQAYEHYSRAFELDPESTNYLLATGESMIATGQYSSATEFLTSNLDKFEHNASLYHLLGQVAMLEGRSVDAVDYYEQAHTLMPEDPMLLEELARVQYAAGQYDECLNSVTLLQQDQEVPRSDLMVLEARCLALMGRTKDARNHYIRLSQLTPDNVDVWIELGTIAWEMDDFHRVAQCSSRIQSLSPDRYEGLMLKGINERHYQRLDQAIEAFQQAASLTTNSVMPHILLGVTLEKNGDFEAARNSYQNALEIDPDSQEARELVARINRMSGMTSAATTN